MRYLLALLLLTTSLCHAQIITTIAGTGVAGYSGDGGPATGAALDNPYEFKFDRYGNLYVADDYNNVVRKITPTGTISTVAGNGYGAGIFGVGGYTGDGGPATLAELNGPTDVVFDAYGNMFIADNSNQVIRKVDIDGIITTVAGTGISGYNGDDIAATTALLNDPFGLVIDSFGNLYFSDAGNHRVRKINSSGIISTVAGNGTPGTTGDGGPATTSQLRGPAWLSINQSGDLYIPDYIANKVRKVNSDGIINTVAGNGGLGQMGDGGPASAANIGDCHSVVFDDSGNYFISSKAYCSIRKVNTLGIISTVVGNDTCGYLGDGGPAISCEIQADAVCSALDRWGNLYIADSKNNRIRMVTYHPVGVPATLPVITTLTLYPDPATNALTITAPALTEGMLMVTNLLGMAVRTQPCHAITTTINVADLPPGMYFVSITGTPYTGRFIKD